MPALQVREMPDELYARLKNSASRNHRSLAQENVNILENALMPQATSDVYFETEENVRARRSLIAKIVISTLRDFNSSQMHIHNQVHDSVVDEARDDRYKKNDISSFWD